MEKVYKNPLLPVEERVSDLLGRMTLEEKVSQLSIKGIGAVAVFGSEGFVPEEAGRDLDAGIGGIQTPINLTPETLADAVNCLQEYLLNETQSGIPALIFAEMLHGVMIRGATVFPQAIGLASTWNTSLIEDIAAAIAKEARACGIVQGLSPVLDLAREPRWGRVEETYGEDPFLCASMGTAYIKGLQGRVTESGISGVGATIKHFAAHGSPEGGVNMSPVPCGERQLRELYLVPFKAGVEAGALCVMGAYSEYDGIPCHASRMLLHDILREEWGFKGYTFCDYGALKMLMSTHRTAGTKEEAALQAITAGMDTEGPNTLVYGPNLVSMVKRGIVSESLIDIAVSRILRTKFLTGLFENPYADPGKVSETINCSSHRTLALKAAQESVVLLKNDRGLLPLDINIKSIAVIGPNAAIAELGDYSLEKKETVSPLQGILNKVSAATRVTYAKGCGIYEKSKEFFGEAVKAAMDSDAAILFLGGASMVDFSIGWGQDAGKVKTCGEGFDVSDLGLPGVQQELVQTIVDTGKPVIVVLINGRPSAVEWIAENTSALLAAWYPGEEGGNALADIIFGTVNPSGKLPVSFPKSAGHIPAFYNYKPSARGHYKNPGTPDKPGNDYVFSDTEPLFSFGYGLSYTQFEYMDLSVEPQKAKPGESINVRVRVKNTGSREGMEVVQLYVDDVVSSVTTPVKALEGFKKVNLMPGEEKEVTFSLGFKELSLIDRNMNETVEPGAFKVMTGNLVDGFEVSEN